MQGNLHVRFLGGGVMATSPCYPALAKGKAPKVFTAAVGQEPVADIPEGRWAARPALQGP